MVAVTQKKNSHPLIEETSTLNDSIYSVGGEEDTELPSIEENPLDSPFSSINSLGNDTSLIG